MHKDNSFQGSFVKIIREVGKDFPELKLKTKISKHSVKILNSPMELYSKSISAILRLTEEIQNSLDYFPDSPLLEQLESNNAKMKKALIMLAFARKEMFS
ncbi:virulence factor [Chlamydiifrater phoenicopteri]|uniref:virulence factor n=1 Tax=Chlamydiifrater phoenicopteri TaxID=2681469 RepID=UPI001BD03A33|nr:virulence factor [Chlamydiifrater phoenicopteri]